MPLPALAPVTSHRRRPVRGDRRRRIARTLTAAALAGGAAVAVTPTPAMAMAPAAAATTGTTTLATTTSIGNNAVYIASLQAGDPYVWGAAGPDAFDCSGLTKYVYGRLGKYLPHKASYQVAYTYRVYTPAPGDLVFFRNSYGYVYHVGIYAGSGYMWHAPHTGDVVRKAKIYSTNVRYGRVR